VASVPETLLAMTTKKATQKDIARRAGVSQSLVSLVMSEASAPVAAETRENILAAARDLSYPLGRREKKIRGRRLLAYIRPLIKREHKFDDPLLDSYEHFYDAIQNCLVENAYAAGFEMIVRPYTHPAEVSHWLIEWGVEGVIWHSEDTSLAEWIIARYPMVQVNRHSGIPADSVLPNQEEIVRLAFNHLRQNGHDRIALLSQARTDTAVRERNQAYLACMKEHNFPPYKKWMHLEDLDEIAELLVARDPGGPTALILGDMQALYLQNKLRKAGFVLPNDLSMVGIDNVSASEFSHPRLTSIDLQIKEIANAVIAAMRARLNRTAGAMKKIEVSPRLVSRESVFQNVVRMIPLLLAVLTFGS